jgi:hypothetical protein
MDKQLKTELRKLLTGRTIRDEEGWLIAVPEGSYLIYHGVSDTTGYRRIRCREERVQVASDNEQAFHTVLKALMDVGLLVNMKTKPGALCALCRFFLTKTVVLCVVPEGDGLVLVQAYTGRSFIAGICCRLAIAKFIKKMNQTQED